MEANMGHLAAAGRQEPLQRTGRSRTLRRTPREVTRRGKPVVIVSSYEEYQRLVRERDDRTPSFRDLLLAIPQGSDGDGFELPERTWDHTDRVVDL